VILGPVDETPNITLTELREQLAQYGIGVGIASPWRFFDRRRITFKKSAHADEQSLPDIAKQRQAWFEGRLDLDPAKLVFIDETSASTKMALRHGLVPRPPRSAALAAGAKPRPHRFIHQPSSRLKQGFSEQVRR